MRFSILFVVASIALGCTELSSGPDLPVQPNSEFIFQVQEAHRLDGLPGEPESMLFLVTAEQLECCNYQIRTQVKTQGEMLRVDVLGMELPGGMCLTALGPARAQVPLSSLAALERIVFRRGGEAAAFRVTVDETSIHVSGPGSELTHPGDTLVWRFPRRSMVYTCGTLTEDSCLCQQFRDTLLARLDLESIAVPEMGLWPYPKETIGYYYNMTPLVYHYSSESEFEHAGELLEQFTRSTLSGRQGVGLALNNWRNEEHASWMVRDPSLPGRQRESRNPR